MTNIAPLLHVFHLVWIAQNNFFKGGKPAAGFQQKGQDFSWVLHNMFLTYIYTHTP